MSSLMISVSGIRGIVGDSFTPEAVIKFAQAFGKYCQGGKVVVGRDGRPSGPLFKHAVFSGLLSVGCEIIDLDQCPTPTCEIMTKELKAAGGIIITASHNPAEWNALKFLNAQGLFLNSTENARLMEIYQKGPLTLASWQQVKSVNFFSDAIKTHLDRIVNLDFIKPDKIKKRKLKVVVDCVNGVGQRILPQLLEQLGCEVVKIHCEGSGIFPHPPEPVPEHLSDLANKVKEVKADVGFATDPDVDRLAVISEKGEPIGEEWTLALCVKFYLSKKTGNVAVNLSTSRMIDDICNHYKVKCFRTKVGEINVTQKILEERCVIGGEGNGGVILPALHCGRDAVVAMAMILQNLAESGKTISFLCEGIPHYHIIKDKVKVKGDPDKAMLKVAKNFKGQNIDSSDGIKITFEDGWVHLRKSNTEPILRIIAEARTKDKSKEFCQKVKSYF